MLVIDAMEMIKRRETELATVTNAMKDTYEPDDEVVLPRYMAVTLYGYLKRDVEELKSLKVEDNQ